MLLTYTIVSAVIKDEKVISIHIIGLKESIMDNEDIKS